jgi:hypothetical protein
MEDERGGACSMYRTYRISVGKPEEKKKATWNT